MYKKNDKKRLYWIIKMYLSGEISGESFCEDFHDSFGLEIDSDSLTANEEKAFDDLNKMVRRHSNSEYEYKNNPGLYYTDKELLEKIKDTQKKLNRSLDEVIEEELKLPDPFVKKAATIVDVNWLMCPDCIDAWESTSKTAMVICPKCNQVLHNPRWEDKLN